MNLRILGPALLIVATSTPAFAEWTWLHPKPQGHTLYDVDFLDHDTAIAVGAVGTVLVTHDAGATWSSQSKVNGMTTTFIAIAGIDGQSAILVGDRGTIMKSHDAGATWTQVSTSEPFPYALEDVDYHAGIALASGYGLIFRSVDEGDTWDAVVPPSIHYTNDVDVITSSVSMAVVLGTLLRSEDGGETWFNVHPEEWPTAVSFSDELNGIAVGHTFAYFTNDGGQSWQQRDLPETIIHVGVTATEVDLVDPQRVFMAARVGGCDPMGVCGSFGMFYRSTDGADTWNEHWAARNLNGLARNEDGLIIVVGDGGSIYRWVDPAWQQGGSPQYDQMGSGRSAFLNPMTGIVVGATGQVESGSENSTFIRTTDGGATWALSGMRAYIADVAYAPAITPAAYCVGRDWISGAASTMLLKSGNGGATWPLLWSSASVPNLNAIEFQSGTHGVAVGASGSFLVIDNDIVAPGTIVDGGSLFDLAFANATTVVAVGGTGGNPPTAPRIVRSVDGGTTWELIHVTGSPFYGVDFASATVGVAVGGGGRIARTDDGGLSWNPVASPTSQRLVAVSFSTELHGMAVGNSGTALLTGDGGATWTLVETPTSTFYDVECFSPTHANLVGGDLNVLEYRQIPLPTLITTFDAQARSFSVDLAWSVRDEANLSGFRIERTGVASGASRSFRDISASARSFQDGAVVPGGAYEYVLVAVDRDGSETYSAPVRVAVSQSELALLPNVPNPFNPSTTIRYVLPARGKVRVGIYDIAGRLVTTLVDREEAAGPYGVEWNGTGADGARVSSGVYLVRIEAGKQALSRKIVLLK